MVKCGVLFDVRTEPLNITFHELRIKKVNLVQRYNMGYDVISVRCGGH
jgi:hypothetical protein